MLSPGEEPRSEPLNIRRVGLVLLATAITATYAFTYRDNIREYLAYLSEDRKPVLLSFDDLSESWTDARVLERLAGLPTQCYANPDPAFALGERVCSVDVKSRDGVPTFMLSFFFSSGRLSHASFLIPWWAHSEGKRSIESMYGPPQAAQLIPRAGVRLYGWRLPDGAALFYNRDKPLNPVEWNAMFWSSATACAKKACFNKQ
jgi:hypothetical protein